MCIAAKKNTDKIEPPFKSLTHALQLACHPRMVELMASIRTADEQARNPLLVDEDDDILSNSNAIAIWSKWRSTLELDNNWRSSRITTIIDIIHRQRDLDPESCFVIFDESVFFLDIV